MAKDVAQRHVQKVIENALHHGLGVVIRGREAQLCDGACMQQSLDFRVHEIRQFCCQRCLDVFASVSGQQLLSKDGKVALQRTFYVADIKLAGGIDFK